MCFWLCWNVCWSVWIGFYPWCIYFCTSHVHAYFMYRYPLFSLFLLLFVMCFFSLSLSLSLSLSWIDCAWHLSINLLRLGTLLVSGLLLLLIHPIFKFDFMMGSPPGLPWELSEMGCSSRAPCHFIGLFQHSSTLCHSNLGMGISLWDTLEVPYHVYTWVLL